MSHSTKPVTTFKQYSVYHVTLHQACNHFQTVVSIMSHSTKPVTTFKQ